VSRRAGFARKLFLAGNPGPPRDLRRVFVWTYSRLYPIGGASPNGSGSRAPTGPPLDKKRPHG
jgi:hypothetical protein